MTWMKRFVWFTFLLLVACSPSSPTDRDSVEAKNSTTPATIALSESTLPIPATGGVADQVDLRVDAQQGPTETVYLPMVGATKTQAPAPRPVPSSGVIADDRVIDQFEDIPTDALRAAADIRVVFFHQSTGGYVKFLGFDCLAGLKNDPNTYPDCVKYETADNPYDWSNWDWTKQWEIADAAAKTEEFENLVPRFQADADVIGMKYCYVDGWNQDFEPYRATMEKMEAAYPDKLFIWATSALWADPGGACNNVFNSCEAIAEFNEQVRAYAQANDKPLFDIAAIESNGGECKVQGFEGLCEEYYADGGGHPNLQASIRLAKGFWWLMSRLSGWDGQS